MVSRSRGPGRARPGQGVAPAGGAGRSGGHGLDVDRFGVVVARGGGCWLAKGCAGPTRPGRGGYRGGGWPAWRATTRVWRRQAGGTVETRGSRGAGRRVRGWVLAEGRLFLNDVTRRSEAAIGWLPVLIRSCEEGAGLAQAWWPRGDRGHGPGMSSGPGGWRRRGRGLRARGATRGDGGPPMGPLGRWLRFLPSRSGRPGTQRTALVCGGLLRGLRAL